MTLTPLGEATDPQRFGIRAYRLTQAIKAGAPVPGGVVIENAKEAVGDIEALKAGLSDYVEPGQLYALRASPGRAEWGGPHTLMALGMNDAAFKKRQKSGGVASATELYRLAIASYGVAVKGIDGEPFDALLAQYGQPEREGAGASALLEATRRLYFEEIGEDFIQDPLEQLVGAIKSMATQWQAPTAQILRRAKDAPEDAHLSLILQKMKHGLGARNGVGRVQFVDSESGEEALEGIFVNSTLSAAGAEPSRQLPIRAGSGAPSLESFDPDALSLLVKWAEPLTHALGDMPEVKFVIDGGKLYITELLIARRSHRAGLRILCDLVANKAISREEALGRVDPASIAGSLHPQTDPKAPRDILARGVSASPGAASGRIVFSANKAMMAAARGESVILVRRETGSDDIRGMHAAKGVLTMRGGMTSHAAVIARGIGLPCVVGATSLRINMDDATLTTRDNVTLREGDPITIDGTAGEVLRGSMRMIEARLDESFDEITSWANDIRRLGVRVNADTPEDAKRAMRFGVDGIGLCRTEHMFFSGERLHDMRRLILSEEQDERAKILSKLARAQRSDFVELFGLMRGHPVTIRLLDPPLHEFLPYLDDDLGEAAKFLEMDVRRLARRIRALSEVNPMLGMRGVRLGIIFPEIYEMQARAIFEAALEVNGGNGEAVVPEIMVPLVSAFREAELVKSRIDEVAKEVSGGEAHALVYRLGVMVETPRAALRAGDLAKSADFFSMGTNDLTQMAYGLSRDDAGRFMREYVQSAIFHEDPFLTLDQEAVGELIHEAAKRGRAVNDELILGLCGEHGGDPASIEFCEREGFDYVSCSPFRVPIAKIAAAQARLRAGAGQGEQSPDKR